SFEEELLLDIPGLRDRMDRRHPWIVVGFIARLCVGGDRSCDFRIWHVREGGGSQCQNGKCSRRQAAKAHRSLPTVSFVCLSVILAAAAGRVTMPGSGLRRPSSGLDERRKRRQLKAVIEFDGA